MMNEEKKHHLFGNYDPSLTYASNLYKAYQANINQDCYHSAEVNQNYDLLVPFNGNLPLEAIKEERRD